MTEAALNSFAAEVEKIATAAIGGKGLARGFSVAIPKLPSAGLNRVGFKPTMVKVPPPRSGLTANTKLTTLPFQRKGL